MAPVVVGDSPVAFADREQEPYQDLREQKSSWLPCPQVVPGAQHLRAFPYPAVSWGKVPQWGTQYVPHLLGDLELSDHTELIVHLDAAFDQF